MSKTYISVIFRIFFFAFFIVGYIAACSSATRTSNTKVRFERLDSLLATERFEIQSDWAMPLATASMNSLANAGLFPPGSTAKHAIKAGFHGVEIHASNGYLIHQFFNGTSNHRDDTYGGTMENKARFFFEVLDAIKKVVPENRIGARFNPSLHGVFGMTMDEDTIPTFDYIVERLDKEYKLAYIHLSEPFCDVSNLEYAVTNIAEHYRSKYSGTLMINAGFDQEKGNAIIDDGNADLVAFGKLYVSNPDLVGRFREHVAVTKWEEETFYTPGKEGYTDYEAKTRQLMPSK